MRNHKTEKEYLQLADYLQRIEGMINPKKMAKIANVHVNEIIIFLQQSGYLPIDREGNFRAS